MYNLPLVQALYRSALSHQERIGSAAVHTKWQVKAEAGSAKHSSGKNDPFAGR